MIIGFIDLTPSASIDSRISGNLNLQKISFPFGVRNADFTCGDILHSINTHGQQKFGSDVLGPKLIIPAPTNLT